MVRAEDHSVEHQVLFWSVVEVRWRRWNGASKANIDLPQIRMETFIGNQTAMGACEIRHEEAHMETVFGRSHRNGLLNRCSTAKRFQQQGTSRLLSNLFAVFLPNTDRKVLDHLSCGCCFKTGNGWVDTISAAPSRVHQAPRKSPNDGNVCGGCFCRAYLQFVSSP